jgi:hypothetical protein
MISSTNKTEHHDKTDILLKVALNSLSSQAIKQIFALLIEPNLSTVVVVIVW